MIDLKNTDCLDLLSSLEDDSVDLICVDPPYFEIVKNEWDNQWSSEEEYLDWCERWTTECFRVLKPNRCFYVWGTTKTDTFIKYKLNVLNQIGSAHYHNWIIWHYDWGGRTKKTYARKHEDLLMYSKGKEFLFNADDVRVERAVKTNMNLQRKMNLLRKKIAGTPFSEKDTHSWKKYNFEKLLEEESALETTLAELEAKNSKFEKGKIPTDVWQKNNHTTSAEYAGWHPTQKPLVLLERIIKGNSNEGDLVLDCFSGSGSTMIAAQNTNRKFIGCELDEEYYEKSLERFKKLTQLEKNT